MFNLTLSHLPCIPSQVMLGNHSINSWRHLKHNLHRMKQVLGQLISQKCKLTMVTQNLSHRSHTPLLWNCVKSELNKLLDEQVICSHSSWSASIIAVPKGNGGKCLVIDYRALNKVTWKIVWLMPRHLYKGKQCLVLLNTRSLHWVSSYAPWWRLYSQNSFCISFLGNMNIWKFLLDLHKHQHISKNWWIKY